MDCIGIVGNAAKQPAKDGNLLVTRFGKTIERSIGMAHGEYYEAVSRGNVWSAVGASAGSAPGTSLSTTGAFTLHNPLNSGVNLVILTASMALPWKTTQYTMGAGSIYYTTHTGLAVVNPSGTPITIRNCLLGSSSSPKALAFEQSTIAAQVPLRPFCSLGAIVSDTSALTPFSVKDALNGEFIVAPGFGINIHGITAAGSSPIVVLAMTWEEVPIT